jgi:hypothetical protein
LRHIRQLSMDPYAVLQDYHLYHPTSVSAQVLKQLLATLVVHFVAPFMKWLPTNAIETAQTLLKFLGNDDVCCWQWLHRIPTCPATRKPPPLLYFRGFVSWIWSTSFCKTQCSSSCFRTKHEYSFRLSLSVSIHMEWLMRSMTHYDPMILDD